MDVVNIVSKLRQIELISNIILSDQQRLLLQYQKKNLLIDNDSSSSEDEKESRLHLKLIGHKNKIARGFYYLHLKNNLKKIVSKDELSIVD